MSRDGSITLTWADGDYAFRLGWGEIELIQEACDAGPWAILERLQLRQCLIGDISETLRCALIGGGTEPAKAKKLIELYVEKWTCTGCVPVMCSFYAAFFSNATGDFQPSVECLRRGL